MRISQATRRSVSILAATGLAALGFAASAQAAEQDDTYDWSATLISVDESAGTAVFEARVESYADIPFDTFSEGDRLTLIWTGRMWAAGVRDLTADPELDSKTLSLPVEFVAATNNDRYLQFRVAVPRDYLAEVAAMEPGVRVTGVSPRMADDWNEGLISLRYYNDLDDDS